MAIAKSTPVTEVLPINDAFFNNNYEFNVETFKSGCYQLVTTQEQVLQMMSSLVDSKFIGIDIENHNSGSYDGFTCLIQISCFKQE